MNLPSGRPKVSVQMITYNHAPFIREAIESILSQQAPFDFEIVVADDASCDGTRDVVAEMVEQHPGRIRLLASQPNLGMNRNFERAWSACRGEYVALLEGDDFWTDKRKLEIQVEYLDENPACQLCGHDVSWVNERSQLLREREIKVDRILKFSLPDLLIDSRLPTASVMARRDALPDFPSWFAGMPVDDWPFQILFAQRGRIDYLPKTMAAYRIHSGGVWSRLSETQRVNMDIELLWQMQRHVDLGHRRIIRRTLLSRYCQLAVLGRSSGSARVALTSLGHVVAIASMFFVLPPRRQLSKTVRVFSPCLHSGMCRLLRFFRSTREVLRISAGRGGGR